MSASQQTSILLNALSNYIIQGDPGNQSAKFFLAKLHQIRTDFLKFFHWPSAINLHYTVISKDPTTAQQMRRYASEIVKHS